MISLDRWERRLGWLSFPGLLRYFAIIHVMVFVIQMFRPDMFLVLDFDRAKILSGEVWRIFTGFFAVSQFGGPSPAAIILLICAVNFAFMVNDGLEAEWGSFKTSVFCYAGMLAILLANLVLPQSIPFSGLWLYTSAFLAFATLFPKVEILLFLIIPVRVAILGIVTGVSILIFAISSPVAIPFVILALGNYIVWAGIPALRGTARVIGSAQRRQRFNAAKAPENEAFHTCATCGRTDASHPELEFRVGGDGQEYCDEHLLG
jgi:hypothetical protein